MFENCNTLLELNAARTKECSVDGADIIAINNAYNAQRQEILKNNKLSYKKIEFRPIVAEKGIPYVALPLAGVSDKLGVLQLTEKGFLI